MIRQAARDFAQAELKPGVIERDEHQKFPAEQVKLLGDWLFRNDGTYPIWRQWNGRDLIRFGYGRAIKN